MEKSEILFKDYVITLVRPDGSSFNSGENTHENCVQSVIARNYGLII